MLYMRIRTAFRGRHHGPTAGRNGYCDLAFIRHGAGFLELEVFIKL